MNLSCGLVGLPNAGKSTLFNALLKKQVAQSANYPFTTIEPNVGVVEVPDGRLERLSRIIADSHGLANLPPIVPAVVDPSTPLRTNMPPVIPAAIRFVDIAGLVKGAHKGEGLGNQFLAHIREVDVIVFVVRDFKNPDIIKTGENPKEDLEILKDELLLKDLESAENQKSKIKNQNYSLKFKNAIEKLSLGLAKGVLVKDIEFDNQEQAEVDNLDLLTSKSFIVVINCDEENLNNGSPIERSLRICAKMEEELASLSEDEQEDYLKEVGVGESGLDRLIKKAYDVLSLMSFYTAGPKEVRAWTTRKGSLAPQAAGVIHTDFERGFIAADIVPFDKFLEAGGWKGAREKGFVRTIGKSEVMPGDVVVEFKFSV